MDKLYFKYLIFSLIVSSVVRGEVAGTIAFQGVLRDPQGTTVVDGNYNLTFKIYDDATSTSNLIYEEAISSVYVSGGVFSVELGTDNSSAWKSVAFDDTYYVGVSVNNETEMSPRTKLTTSPYSMAVYGANNVVPNNGNVGIGTLSPTASLHVYADDGDDVLNIENSGGVQFNVSTSGTMTIGGDIKIRDTGAGIEFPSGLRQIAPDALHASRGAENSDDLILEADADISGETDGNNGSGDILMTVAGGTKAVVTNSGNFGIGTTSPGYKLDVNGTLNVTGKTTLAALADGTAATHAVNFDQIYPVGSIYMNATNSTNPGTLLGIGTWTALATGRVLLGAGSNGTNSFAAGATGGSDTKTLSTSEMPSHTHYHDHGGQAFNSGGAQTSADHYHGYTQPTGTTYITSSGTASSSSYSSTAVAGAASANTGNDSHDHGHSTNVDLSGKTSDATGSGNAFDIKQPYLVVYMWKRIS